MSYLSCSAHKVNDVPRSECRIRSTRDCELFPSFLSSHTSSVLSSQCDSRKYTYFFPTYLLIPPKPGSAFERTLQQYVASMSPSTSTSMSLPNPFWEDARDSSTPEEDLLRKRLWRATADHVAQLRATLQKFQGTHNFHNFTVGRDFSDRSNQRHMKTIDVRSARLFWGYN